MDGLKMVRIFLALTLAMSVASQPLDNIPTSGAATMSTQVLNWAQVGFEAFLEWAKRGFGLCTEEENTITSKCRFFTSFLHQKLKIQNSSFFIIIFFSLKKIQNILSNWVQKIKFTTMQDFFF